MKSFNADKIRALILDMDGVLWRGSNLLVDLPEVFAQIDQLGLAVALATNNATSTTAHYYDKFRRLGVTLEPGQIINSALATSFYLKQRHPGGGPVYIVGEDGLHATLEEQGFYHAEKDVLAVIGSLDRGINYRKMEQATLLIRAGAPFIGTNADKSFPAPEGLLPGAGAILAAIEAASDTAPILIGKPEPALYLAALEKLGTAPGETLMVGDRLETDIAGAQNVGCSTALVLSGVSTLEMAQAWQPAPDIIAPDLTNVLKRLALNHE
ncbi:MAG: HAD-IIA family hydrolase [Chloroflexota bacterium]